MKTVMILAALTAMVTMTGCSEKKEASKDVVSFDEVLTSRRSVRSYDATKKISEAEVRTLLKATQEAPSWPLSPWATELESLTALSAGPWTTL